jgi:antitoxin component of MazEF toxin-antitoxin module
LSKIVLMEQIIMRTTLRKIGNSRGVLLTKEIIDKLDIVDGQEIEVSLNDEFSIVLKPTKHKKKKRPALNLDLSTWEAQFKTAIKKGELPEKDVFEGMSNKFDQSW